MSNSKQNIRLSHSLVALVAWAVFFSLGSWTFGAEAQARPEGFAVERFFPSAPGGGWMVMDDLDLPRRLGGALSFTTGYAHNPLRLTRSDGLQQLALVRHQAFFEFGASITYQHFRVYFNASSPLVVQGDSGSLDGYAFVPGSNPATQQDCGQKRVCADLGWNPDTIADPRVGFDARVYGDSRGPFRLGISTQIIAPSGLRAEYLSDRTFRAMDRVLFAGDIGGFTYAGQIGVHVRPLNDGPIPGSPRGTELLFGFAGGARFSAGATGPWSVVLGPEFFGATPFRSAFGASTTALEALLSGRLESAGITGRQFRLKLGAGVGLISQMGAPDWRIVAGVEMFSKRQ